MSFSLVIWWNEDTVSNKEKMAAFSEGVEDLVDAGDGQLAQGADGVKLFVVDDYPDITVFLGMATIGLAYGEGECWIRPAARYWSSTASAV